MIIGGGDNGVLTMYSAHRILASKSDPVIGQTEKHSGPVRALDFNPFQVRNLKMLINECFGFLFSLVPSVNKSVNTAFNMKET